MVNDFDDRKKLLKTIIDMEQELKELGIRYEQYFAGIEKREPYQERQDFARRIRQMTNKHIVQTDLRFRRQNIATRFHSYAGSWDRILRLMDEGKFHRPTGKKAATRSATTKTAAGKAAPSEADVVFKQLAAAHHASGSDAPPPKREQVAAALEKQRNKIKEKFGDREVEFNVVVEGGKPRIKVRPKS